MSEPRAASGHTPRGKDRPSRWEDGRRPGDDFNAAMALGDIVDLFARHGWKRHRERPDGVVELTRPGKDAGVSATVGFCKGDGGRPLVHVFTNNTSPLEQGETYGAFAAYTFLAHGGDWLAATDDLARRGYGKLRPQPRATWGGQEPADGASRDGRAGANGQAHGPPPNGPAPDGTPCRPRGVAVIIDYFQAVYRPVFRRGNAIHCADGRDVTRSEACDVPDSDLIERLAEADDAPRFKGGAVNRDRLPGFFKTWSKVAWGDLLKSLPDEDTAELGADAPAREEFRRLVREALLVGVTLGDVIAHHGVTQTERRSLIGWSGSTWTTRPPWPFGGTPGGRSCGRGCGGSPARTCSPRRRCSGSRPICGPG